MSEQTVRFAPGDITDHRSLTQQCGGIHQHGKWQKYMIKFDVITSAFYVSLWGRYLAAANFFLSFPFFSLIHFGCLLGTVLGSIEVRQILFLEALANG